MTDQIVSRAAMRERGQLAFAANQGRDDHGMNPWAPGIVEWQAGWDEAKHVAKCLAKRAAHVQHAPAAGRCVEVRQEAVTP